MGYDSSSPREEDKIHGKLTTEKVKNVSLGYISLKCMFLCCQVNGFLPKKLSFLNFFAWH